MSNRGIMAYPISPFKDNFNREILTISQRDDNKTNRQEEGELVEALKLTKLLQWLCTTPKVSSYRVNTITHSTEEILLEIRSRLHHIPGDVAVESSPHFPDVILINNMNTERMDLIAKSLEIVVDIHCAAAVLRGAHVFAPGIMGMQSGIKIGDQVSIYADLENNCRRGSSKIFNSHKKIFIGNGIARQIRSQLFGENLTPSGIAVEVYSNISGCIAPDSDSLSIGSCLLQNLPSIICVRVLNPQPGETILDMCAAPGNKTTHIAALMGNKGTIIAIDKTPSKIRQLKEKCTAFKAKVSIYLADSTKIFIRDKKECLILNGPPFKEECFDRILLDAPCSALGKRPQLYNNTSEKVIKSFVPLQRKLFRNAVHLLKINGCLVYSTCTITQAENEGLVAWALKTFDCLKLCKTEPYLGECGWTTDGLSIGDLEKIQRFGPDSQIDSVGFFIARFVKHSSLSLDVE